MLQYLPKLKQKSSTDYPLKSEISNTRNRKTHTRSTHLLNEGLSTLFMWAQIYVYFTDSPLWLTIWKIINTQRDKFSKSVYYFDSKKYFYVLISCA